MVDVRLISGKASTKIGPDDEWYWLGRVSETKKIMIGEDNISLELAILLFNKDYVDLRICNSEMIVEITPKGIAALRSHGSVTG